MKIITYACIPISFDFLSDQSNQQNKQSVSNDLSKKIIDWCKAQPFSNKLAEDFFKGFELIGFNSEQISLLDSAFKQVATINPQSSQNTKYLLVDTINHAEDISQYFSSLISNFSVEVQDAVLTASQGKSEDTIVFYTEGYRCNVKFDFAGAFCKSENLSTNTTVD